MRNDLASLAVPLPRGAFLRIEPAPGSRLECVRGHLWLTMDHDRRDVLLGAGEGFTLDRDAPALVGAMADSALIVLPREAPWAG
jgi:hypothetical protein